MPPAGLSRSWAGHGDRPAPSASRLTLARVAVARRATRRRRGVGGRAARASRRRRSVDRVRGAGRGRVGRGRVGRQDVRFRRARIRGRRGRSLRGRAVIRGRRRRRRRRRRTGRVGPAIYGRSRLVRQRRLRLRRQRRGPGGACVLARHRCGDGRLRTGGLGVRLLEGDLLGRCRLDTSRLGGGVAAQLLELGRVPARLRSRDPRRPRAFLAQVAAAGIVRRLHHSE